MGRKIVIASTGTETLICIDGKVYGEHVERIEFSHTGGLIAEIKLQVNDMPVEGERGTENMKIVICIIGIVAVLFIANRVMNRITNAVYKCMGFDIDKISEEYSEKLIKKIKKWLRK